MNENEGKKRREWVKNAAIIFLTIMLILTFFSNTIMNYSLPEVATQYVQSGSITARVRGTGNVEATDPYNVMVKDTRVISSVAVKQGDVVEKDQVLYYLEDKESDELKAAETELADLELAYMKGLFGSTVSPEVINKVASGNTDSFSSYRSMVTDMQQRLQAAEDRVNECQKVVESITLENTISTNDAGVNTIPEENEVSQADTDLTNAQTSAAEAEREFNNAIAVEKAKITNEINELKKRIADVQTLVDNAAEVTKEDEVINPDSGEMVTTTAQLQKYIEQRDEAETKRDEALNAIYVAVTSNGSDYTGGKNINELKAWIGDRSEYNTLLQDYDIADAQFNYAVTMLAEAEKYLNGYESNASTLESLNNQLLAKEAELNRVSAIAYEPGDSVKNAQSKLNQAKQNLTDKTNANKQASAAALNRLANAEAALKNAQAVYELLKTEQTELAANINAELDLSKASKDIANKKAEIEKLKENSTGATINAPVAGTITNLAYVAGESTKPEEAAAVIQVEGKGYTMSISVTNEQAKKVQVGDTAELQNAWYYDDVQVILTAIKPDPDSPAQKKLLVFNVTGESVQAGQALNISVGQRSSEYEFVVPNSAVREDNNGKFILIVESRSGPLNNRYIATRVDVDVLASDDTNTAISAALYGYEYVITTSTKPVEAGKQVRLNES